MRTKSRRLACAFESLEGKSLAAIYMPYEGIPGIAAPPPQPAALLLPAVQKVREAAATGSGGGPLVRVFSGASGLEYRGGVQVAAGDVTG